jgi:hypothetical protein
MLSLHFSFESASAACVNENQSQYQPKLKTVISFDAKIIAPLDDAAGGVHLTRMPNSPLLRCLLPLALLLTAGGCRESPTEVHFEVARKAGQEAGFAEGQARGFDVGWNEGHDKGFEKGRQEGRAQVIFWAPIGLGAGIALGLLIAGVIRRSQLTEARRQKAHQATFEKVFGRSASGVSPTVTARFERLKLLRDAVGQALTDAAGAGAADLHAYLAPRLIQVEENITTLSGLTARLQAALTETPADAAAVLAEREAALEKESDPSLRDALAQSVSAQRRAVEARQRAETGLKRCDLQLEAIEAFLSHARMSIATTQAEESAGWQGLGAEVDAISAAVRTAQAELAAI